MPSKLENLNSDLEEMRRLMAAATRQRVKDSLSIEIRKIETEITLHQDSLNELSNSAGATSSQTTQPRVKCYDVKLTNYAWDQSDKFVKVFVSLKEVHNILPEKVSCSFDERSMLLTVKELENRNYTLSIKNLQEKINIERSYWKVKTDMVLIYMAKQSEGKTWKGITGEDNTPKEPKVPDMDPQEDISSSLMKMMKKMYDEGDDEMKRTIAQVWTQNQSMEQK